MEMNDDCEDGGADSVVATVDGEDQAKLRPASQPTPQTRLRSLQRAAARKQRAFCQSVGGGPLKAKKIELSGWNGVRFFHPAETIIVQGSSAHLQLRGSQATATAIPPLRRGLATPHQTNAAATSTMSSLWIINKAGGLIFQSEHFVHPNAASMPNGGRLSSNEYLVLAGTLHGIHAITAKLNPVPNRACSGIESLDSDHFTVRVMLTPTGTKFVLVTSPAHPNPAGVLQRCYEAYADHVMKNPFYTPEMPVRVETFDKAVEALVKA